MSNWNLIGKESCKPVLYAFRDSLFFIYQCKNDLNCPYSLTLELVEKLRNAGAKVEFVTTNEGGHGIIDKEYLPFYFKWIKDTIEY